MAKFAYYRNLETGRVRLFLGEPKRGKWVFVRAFYPRRPEYLAHIPHPAEAGK